MKFELQPPVRCIRPCTVLAMKLKEPLYKGDPGEALVAVATKEMAKLTIKEIQKRFGWKPTSTYETILEDEDRDGQTIQTDVVVAAKKAHKVLRETKKFLGIK